MVCSCSLTCGSEKWGVLQIIECTFLGLFSWRNSQRFFSPLQRMEARKEWKGITEWAGILGDRKELKDTEDSRPFVALENKICSRASLSSIFLGHHHSQEVISPWISMELRWAWCFPWLFQRIASWALKRKKHKYVKPPLTAGSNTSSSCCSSLHQDPSASPPHHHHFQGSTASETEICLSFYHTLALSGNRTHDT